MHPDAYLAGRGMGVVEFDDLQCLGPAESCNAYCSHDLHNLPISDVITPPTPATPTGRVGFAAGARRAPSRIGHRTGIQARVDPVIAGVA
ncbi:hypothetical protein GCM10027176_25480 [Actinoallomurus bryophytorum]